ncbi:MAG TPA: ATP-binding protein [Acidimicrobiales bacterium]|nr:ATP-binding protein [Acidimicrobiales bacterium]
MTDNGTSPPATGGDVVELSIPVKADLVVLARLTAATVASRAGFGVEEIEDLRLAVEELCLSLVGPEDNGRLQFVYRRTDDAVTITCTFEPEEAGNAPGNAGNPRERGGDELSLRILDALVDEHGRDGDGRGSTAWLRKRRARSAR